MSAARPSRHPRAIPPKTAGASLPSTAANVSVMIVDDDQDIREVLCDILADAGYSAVTAMDGAEALEILKKVKPCLILLDLNMPVMDGFEFRRAQRRDPTVAKVPTVVISALHQMGERVADLAADEVLEKPVQLERLLQVVKRYCGSNPLGGAGGDSCL